MTRTGPDYWSEINAHPGLKELLRDELPHLERLKYAASHLEPISAAALEKFDGFHANVEQLTDYRGDYCTGTGYAVARSAHPVTTTVKSLSEKLNDFSKLKQSSSFTGGNAIF
jgi:hypothetical protein